MKEVRVLIADDHALLRHGLRQVIEAAEEMKVVCEANNGRDALEQARSLRPDVAILDVDMPVLDGFGAARAMRQLEPRVEVIFLTVHRERDLLSEALELGAKGYVLKDSAISDIISAVRAVAAGQHYTSPALISHLVDRGSRSTKDTQAAGIQSLTQTERRILKLIAEYKTSKQIADELFVSHRTVQTHRTNICQKLNLEGNHALMKFALANKDGE